MPSDMECNVITKIIRKILFAEITSKSLNVGCPKRSMILLVHIINNIPIINPRMTPNIGCKSNNSDWGDNKRLLS